jgi:hypothetical protein
MLIVNRLLDCVHDFEILKEILNEYLTDAELQPNYIWSIECVTSIVDHILKNFNPNNKNHMFIGGTFCDGKLITIFVGEKMGLYLDYKDIDALSYWFTLLIYSRTKSLSNPAIKIFDAGTLVVQEMEKQKYYAFYQFFKCPIKVGALDISSKVEKLFENFSIMNRYHNLLEYLVKKDTELKDCNTNLLKRLITGRNRKSGRQIILTSHHLKNEYRDFL